ncbi:pyruvate, phosphate dikinase [Patulibacter defluvii]|uniref:pyruvate, phosphate dikinase n=1 Tax=Patulibacter defluvii TaxID=3095358 RepID=UPI002A74C036|nr:pyruvate, phosphate dikinase [Patulibacter sp. DM4]
MTASSWVQDFAEGSKEQRDLLGGKGANVAEMTRILGADRVPGGFTITTEACVAYMRADRAYPEGLGDQVAAALARLEQRAGKRLGDAGDPLLVSVRSGARESMPGMMDTVLNLGLTDASVEGLAARTANPRFAWDSYRRFVQMYGNVVKGVPGEAIEETIAGLKRERGVTLDTELDTAALQELVARFKALYRDHTGEDFPQDPQVQLDGAIRAVFDSWMGERAVHYRRINRIPDDWGTAVNVQQMVFGNKGDSSCSGVAFSRDEVTGEPTPSGDFLVNAQGEDVVSGVRNTQDLAELADRIPAAHGELLEILRTLERHYGDMQDTEFTVEEGRLYMLQTRNAKRPAQAAVRFAVDAVEEGLLDRPAALLTLDAEALETLLHPTFDRSADYTVLGTGVNASPGAAKGAAVFTAEEAVHAAERGEKVILVRPFTEADDVAGFHAAQGILTSEGGKASHAALVARGMGKPCVCGATALQVDLAAHVARIGEVLIHEGDLIAINGTTGEITTDDVPLVEPSQDPAMAAVLERFETVLGWADELRVLGVRTNADTPEDAARARRLGAEGIGLCRTEHMFMEADRQPKMRRMIMAEAEEERRAALAELRPLQQQDFEGLFEAMAGQPVTIRLLDPPLHEFLPKKEEVGEELHQAYADKRYHRVGVLADVLERIETLSEANPMLGTRGVRLGLLYPEVFEMQAEAIFAAAVAVRERTGTAPALEVMIPLVGYERELEIMRGFVVAVGDRHGLALGEDYVVGTMIELPRACFLADSIAHHADFFSFGTNDLTQTGLGFSRDDIEGKILARYIDFKILDRSPFETIDTPGVGQMLRMGAWLGRKTKLDLKLGVCGEHGGDPDSIAFFHDSGIDYVSCSPFRVPIARVAAAQAAVRSPRP